MSYNSSISNAIVWILLALIAVNASLVRPGSLVDHGSNAVILELDEEIGKGGVDGLLLWLEGQKEVSKSSIRFISREESMEQMSDEWFTLGQVRDANPFLDMIVFRLNSNEPSINQLPQLKQVLESRVEITEIFQAGDQTQLENSGTIQPTGRLSLIEWVILIGVLLILNNRVRQRIRIEESKMKLVAMIGGKPIFLFKKALVAILKEHFIAMIVGLFLVLLLTIGYLKIRFNSNGVDLSALIYNLSWAVIAGLIVAVVSTYIILNLYLRNIYKSQ